MPPKPKLLQERFIDKINVGDDCWEFDSSKDKDGYGSIWSGPSRDTQFRAHRLSYVLFVGPLPEWLSVLHHCDNPGCVKPSHLYLGTQTDNMRDKVARGRCNARRGSTNHHAVLSEQDVIKIRELLASGEMGRDVARRFGVAPSTICGINRGRSWSWLS